MNKAIGLLAGVLITATTVFASNSKGEKTAFDLDKKASKVYWTAKKVTGEHTGYVELSDGKVWVANNNVVGAEVNMNLNGIVCTDLKDEQWNKKLVDHLKSDDFFSVEKFPLANFEITSMTKNGGSADYNVKGKLTIKGITHEISFPAKAEVKNGVVSASGKATVDRTKWNIRYGSGKFFEGLGDKMIYDDFDITFDIVSKTKGAELSSN